MAWRTARCLDTLLHQVDAAYPGRDKSSDGTLGDAAHQATHSEHNPDEHGVVRARDLTNDPAHGFVSRKLAEALVNSRDPRILYVISNAEICSSKVQPWVWRAYGGSNPHREHMHLSVVDNPELYDDERSWSIDGAAIERPPAEGHVLIKRGATGPAVLELQRRLGILTTGAFDGATDTAVRDYQTTHGLDVDGEVGPLTWDALLIGAPPVTPVQSQIQMTSKGSWYSQYDGKYHWHDGQDDPNSAALTGTPDDAQGVAMPLPAKLGSWWAVRAPNSKVSIEQVTDRGPAAWTGRTIDISAAAAERFGYSPSNFPTDSIFTFWPIPVPREVAGLSPVNQAIQYRDIRKGLSLAVPTPPVVPQPVPIPTPIPQPQPQPFPGETMDDKLRVGLITEIVKPQPDRRWLQLQLLDSPPTVPSTPATPVVVPPGAVPPNVPIALPAPPTSPVTTGIQSVSTLALLASLLGSGTGVIGTPIGPDMTTTGMLLPLISLAVGAFGIPSPIVNLISGLFAPKTKL